MYEEKAQETKLREHQGLRLEVGAEESPQQSSGHQIWKIVGASALVLAAMGVIASWKDIRRYIKISRM